MMLALVRDATDVERIAQQVIDVAPAEGAPATHPLALARTDLGRKPQAICLLFHLPHGSKFEVQTKYRADGLRLIVRRMTGRAGAGSA